MEFESRLVRTVVSGQQEAPVTAIISIKTEPTLNVIVARAQDEIASAAALKSDAVANEWFSWHRRFFTPMMGSLKFSEDCSVSIHVRKGIGKKVDTWRIEPLPECTTAAGFQDALRAVEKKWDTKRRVEYHLRKIAAPVAKAVRSRSSRSLGSAREPQAISPAGVAHRASVTAGMLQAGLEAAARASKAGDKARPTSCPAVTATKPRERLAVLPAPYQGRQAWWTEVTAAAVAQRLPVEEGTGDLAGQLAAIKLPTVTLKPVPGCEAPLWERLGPDKSPSWRVAGGHSPRLATGAASVFGRPRVDVRSIDGASTVSRPQGGPNSSRSLVAPSQLGSPARGGPAPSIAPSLHRSRGSGHSEQGKDQAPGQDRDVDPQTSPSEDGSNLGSGVVGSSVADTTASQPWIAKSRHSRKHAGWQRFTLATQGPALTLPSPQAAQGAWAAARADMSAGVHSPPSSTGSSLLRVAGATAAAAFAQGPGQPQSPGYRQGGGQAWSPRSQGPTSEHGMSQASEAGWSAQGRPVARIAAGPAPGGQASPTGHGRQWGRHNDQGSSGRRSQHMEQPMPVPTAYPVPMPVPVPVAVPFPYPVQAGPHDAQAQAQLAMAMGQMSMGVNMAWQESMRRQGHAGGPMMMPGYPGQGMAQGELAGDGQLQAKGGQGMPMQGQMGMPLGGMPMHGMQGVAPMGMTTYVPVTVADANGQAQTFLVPAGMVQQQPVMPQQAYHGPAQGQAMMGRPGMGQ